ncbi:hypothetical protein HID58_007944, partial [Brassica napus]
VIPGVAPCPDHRNLQESRFSNFLCKVQLLIAVTRILHRRTQTLKSTGQEELHVTSGDKEKHNRRRRQRRHELVSMEPLVRYSQRTRRDDPTEKGKPR